MYTNNKNIVIGDNYKATFKTEADAAAFVVNANAEILNKAKQEKIKQLHTNYQEAYNEYLSQYPKAEVDSFPIKQAEALAYQKDNNAPTPVIDDIVSKSGGTKEDHIQSVLDKISYLAQKEGAMLSIRDKIKACTTQADLDKVVL